MRIVHPYRLMAALIALGLVSLLSRVPGAHGSYRSQEDQLGPSYRESHDSYSHPRQLARDKAEKAFLEWAQICQTRYKTYQERSSGAQGSDNRTLDRTHARVIVVDQLGHGNFTTVQAAIDSVETPNERSVIIKVNPGVYREKVVISTHRPYITIQGAGRDVTTIVWNSTANDTDPDGSYLKTFRSASFAVDADNFIAKDVSFLVDYLVQIHVDVDNSVRELAPHDVVHAQNSAPIAPPGAIGGQAVAFRVSGDKAALYNCGFHGGQDTLYDHKGRHYFQDCYITGTVDYVFGDGLSMYKNCTMKSIGPGYVTAQRRQSALNYTGFSIVDSTITGVGPSYLGRAWGNYSRVVFSRTLIDVPVAAGGWNDWDDTSRDWKVFYGQFECSGSGANLTGRVSWSHNLTASEAEPFLSASFIDGDTWLPDW